jgi:hypothetical protein
MSAYGEQAAAKVEMGLRENIPPMSQDFLDKFENIRGAVAHQVYEEESEWSLELKQSAPSADQVKLAKRYAEEFTRYVGGDLEIPNVPRIASA